MNFPGSRFMVRAYLCVAQSTNQEASLRLSAQIVVSVMKVGQKGRRRSLKRDCCECKWEELGHSVEEGRAYWQTEEEDLEFGADGSVCVCGEGEEHFQRGLGIFCLFFFKKKTIRTTSSSFLWRIIPELWCCPRIMKETLTMKFAWKTKMVKRHISCSSCALLLGLWVWERKGGVKEGKGGRKKRRGVYVGLGK